MSSEYDDTKRTPQEYEVLTGGGAETAEIAKRGISRRQMLRRASGLALGLVGAEAGLGALMMLYPNWRGSSALPVTLKNKSTYVGAEQKNFLLDQKGIFYEAQAKSYIMHLQAGGSTAFLLSGTAKTNTMDAQTGSRIKTAHTGWRSIRSACTWAAKCHSAMTATASSAHATAPITTSMASIWMAQRRAAWTASCSRLMGVAMSYVDTGKLNQHVERPDATTRSAAGAMRCGLRGELVSLLECRLTPRHEVSYRCRIIVIRALFAVAVGVALAVLFALLGLDRGARRATRLWVGRHLCYCGDPALYLLCAWQRHHSWRLCGARPGARHRPDHSSSHGKPAAGAGDPDRRTYDLTLQRGAALFGQYCATCHGFQGQGLAGPKLNNNPTVNKFTDDDLTRIISAGIPLNVADPTVLQMPAWSSKLWRLAHRRRHQLSGGAYPLV